MGPPADSREGPRHVRERMSTGETQLAAHESGNGVSTDGTPLLSLRGVSKNFGAGAGPARGSISTSRRAR